MRVIYENVFLAILLAVAVCGCADISYVKKGDDVDLRPEVQPWNRNVVDFLYCGDQNRAEELARAEVYGGVHPSSFVNDISGRNGKGKSSQKAIQKASAADIAMHRLNLCSALLLKGDRRLAHRELMLVRDEIEHQFDPEQTALGLFHAEREKYFKGDGYERGTMYAFLALSYLEMADFQNAIKCVKNGMLADTDSEKDEYRCDYALLPYIGYVAAARAGADWAVESERYSRIVHDLTGFSPKDVVLPDALLLVWTGDGTKREKGGEYDEIRYVRKGSRSGSLNSAFVKTAEGVFQSLPNMADFNFQAATRGRRYMDNILESKANLKRGFAASGNALLSFGASCFVAAGVSGNVAVSTVFLGVGGLCIGLGCPTHLVGMMINAEADDRCWGALPGRILVIPINFEGSRRPPRLLSLHGLIGWDVLLDKEIPVDFGGREEGGIPVVHISALGERNAICKAKEVGLRSYTDAVMDKMNEFGEDFSEIKFKVESR